MADASPVVSTLKAKYHRGLGDRAFLHLLAYPLSPAYRPMELPSGARMRPRRRTLEMAYTRSVERGHFDPRAAKDPEPLDPRSR